MLVVSGGVDCRRRRWNVYDEASTLCQRQQNGAFKCTQWQICSVCNLTVKDSTRRFVLLKLTTDRHEASCSLFVTAELLVWYVFMRDMSINVTVSFEVTWVLSSLNVKCRFELPAHCVKFLCWQITDDDDEAACSQGSQLASQALHVLPFYSLLPADRQAKVCSQPFLLLHTLCLV